MSSADTASWTAHTPDDLAAVAKSLLAFAGPRRILAFYGPVGAGKTACIQALCRQLGISEAAASPSFGLVHPYLTQSEGAGTVYHVDLYRLHDAEEAWALGLDDWLLGGDWVLVEWPELIRTALLDLPVLHVVVKPAPDGSRTYLASTQPPAAEPV